MDKMCNNFKSQFTKECKEGCDKLYPFYDPYRIKCKLICEESAKKKFNSCMKN